MFLRNEDPLMVHHAAIGETPLYPLQFDPAAVHPFDGLKVALEQIVYGYYLSPLLNSQKVCESLINRGVAYAQALPADLYKEEDSAIRGIYRDTRNVLAQMAGNVAWMVGDFLKRGLHPATIKAIFLQPQRKEYIHRPYLTTLKEDLLDIVLHRIYGWYDQSIWQDGIRYDANLYYPSLQLVQNYNPAVSEDQNDDYQVVCHLQPIHTQGYNLKAIPSESRQNRYDFLNAYNLKGYSLDQLLGIMASYSVDHTTYAMTPSPGDIALMVDVCFDLVTGSTFTQPRSGSVASYDAEEFFQTVSKMVSENRLQNVQDKGLFGELLRRVGAEPEIVSYFTKPVNAITAAEAYSFRNSIYAGLVDDRITGMEAAEDDPALADPDTAPVEDTGDMGTSTDPTDTPDLDTPMDTEEKKEDSDAKPSIDPNKMLLEIAKPNEPMSDYIFRDMVARRIANIIKNPPENAMPNDLLMLKRWRSRWLYLVSTPCLRDFLTRISLRLTNP